MYTAEEIAKYYDDWTSKYLEVYGDIIQAFRPIDHRMLLDYMAENAGVGKAEKILDAGCGVCGPAIYFADRYNTKIDALTVSGVQAAIGKKRVNARLLGDKISVIQGDYHKLGEYYKQATFDLVLFLESLGHSDNVDAVATGVAAVLKPGGSVYIKDFFKKTGATEAEQQKIDFVIGNMNKNYSYNALTLDATLKSFTDKGFTVDFVKPLGFIDDIAIRQKFETKFDIDNFEGLKEFAPADWLQVKLTS